MPCHFHLGRIQRVKRDIHVHSFRFIRQAYIVPTASNDEMQYGAALEDSIEIRLPACFKSRSLCTTHALGHDDRMDILHYRYVL